MSEDSILSQTIQHSRHSRCPDRLVWLSKLLELAQIDVQDWMPEPYQLPELYSAQLGDEIYSYLPAPFETADSQECSLLTGRFDSDFYLICEGKIRLLSYLPSADRDVTTLVLSMNQTIGAESMLGTELDIAPLPYRAVASNSVLLARFSAKALVSLLSQFPTLQTYLIKQATYQQRLIFFKTLTPLQHCSTAHLYALMPYLRQQAIAAGASLADAAPGSVGRFWLRQGEIQTSAQPISPGESWGYPATTPNTWVARTDVIVYQLPAGHWDAATVLLPVLTSLLDPSMVAPLASIPTTTAAMEQKHTPLARPPIGNGVHQPAVHQPAPPTHAPHALAPVANRDQPEAAPILKPLRRRVLDRLNHYPWVEQHSSSDCGVACLAMISHYWGKRFPLPMLRQQAGVGRAGMSLTSLARTANGLGFRAQPVRASLERMAEQQNPWIAHWQGNHYVVVYRVGTRQVTIANPAVGQRSLSQQAFEASWTGYALVLDPTDHLNQTESKQPSMGRYFKAIARYRSVVLQIILVSVLIQIFSLVTPLFTQIILDRVVAQKSLSTLNGFAVGLALFSVSTLALSSMRQHLLSYFSTCLDLTLMSDFINHTLSLPLTFFESRRVEDILTRVQDNQKIQQFLIQHGVLTWLDCLTGLMYLGLMLYYNWRLTLLVLVLIPPIVLFTLAATPLRQNVSREIFQETADQHSMLVETLTGIGLIKAAAAEQALRQQWDNHLTRQVNLQCRAQNLEINLQTCSGLIHSLGSVLLFWYGATLLSQDQLTIGQFVAFNMMVGYIITPVVTLTNLWHELQEALISVERLNDVFEAKSEASAQPQPVSGSTLHGSVEFVTVSFRYDEDDEPQTLQNVSFTVQAGQTVAIVGRHGAGKSTLVKLIEGLHHPTRGQVMIDGHNIRHLSPYAVRSQFGVVPQDSFLFSDTILNNITMHRPDYTLEQVIEAARQADAHSFIQALPLGYHTPVGERGSQLSGGQRQQIAIARALLGNPQILILDEATSSLDSESERRLLHMQTQGRRDRTTFIISHRLSTLRHAHKILVIDRGILLEQGTHAELLGHRGLYYHLAQRQLDL